MTQTATGSRTPNDPDLLHQRIAELEETVAHLRAELAEAHQKAHSWQLQAEQHACQSQLLQTIIDTIPSPVFYKDAQGHYLGCNPWFAHLLGLPKDQVIGQSAHDMHDRMPHQLLTIYHNDHAKTLARQTDDRHQVHEAHDGDEHQRTFVTHKAAFQSPDGRYDGVVGMMINVTEHINLTKQLEQWLGFTRLILTISTKFIRVSMDDLALAIQDALPLIGNLLEVDRCDIALFGDRGSIENVYAWRKRTATATEPSQGLHVQTYPWAMQRLCQSHVIAVTNVVAMPLEAAAEREFFRAIGVRAFLSIPMVCESLIGAFTLSMETDERDWSEAVIDVAKVVGDIFANAIVRVRLDEQLHQAHTDLEERVQQRTQDLIQANRMLEQSEARMVLITDALPALIAYVDTDMCYRFNNYHYEEWFGLSREQIQGRHVREVIGEHAYEQSAPQLWQALAGKRVEREFQMPISDGSTRYMHSSYIPHIDTFGKVLGFFVLGQDITEQVRSLHILEERVIERTREIERRRRVAEVLYDILRVLNSNAPTDTILTYILRQACDILGARAAALYRPTDHHYVVIETSYGFPDEVADVRSLPILQNNKIKDFFDNNVIILNDLPEWWAMHLPASPEQWQQFQVQHGDIVATSLRCWMHCMDGFLGAMAIPVFIGETLFGNMELYYAHPHSEDPEEIALATTLGRQAALAIENARLREQAEQLATLQERQRVARDLHDSAMQSIYSVNLFTHAAQEIIPDNVPPLLAAHLEEIRSAAQQAHTEMRLLIHELRPPVLAQKGLRDALHQRLMSVEERVGIRTHLHADEVCRLPPTIERELYWIATEALNNVLKHAHASHVTVILQMRSRPNCSTVAVLLEVRDNGHGFDQSATLPGCIGLHTLRERTEMICGILTIDSIPGAGTSLRVTLDSPCLAIEEEPHCAAG